MRQIREQSVWTHLGDLAQRVLRLEREKYPWSSAGDEFVIAETVWLDSRSLEAASTVVLTSGATYRVVVDGTFSWVTTTLPFGSPEADAMYPSHVRTNTQVGRDVETIFGSDGAGSYPAHSNWFQINLGAGWTHVEPVGGPFSAPQTGHLYTYELVGAGNVAAFRINDSPLSDNYGLIKIVIYRDNRANVPPDLASFNDHSARHEQGGADAIRLDDLATPDDNSDLNASTTRHGLLPKLSGVSTEFFNGLGIWATPSGGSGAPDYILIRDEKAANTAGGTFTSGAWQTRTLNTEVSDTGGHASLASNQITLAPGTYVVKARAPAAWVGRHKIRLQNITDGTTLIVGSSQWANGGVDTSNHAFLEGKFTLAASKALEVQHRCEVTVATSGFGIETNFGVVEVYTVIAFEKVD